MIRSRLILVIGFAMLASSAHAGDKFVVAGFSTKFIEGHTWAIPLGIEAGIFQKHNLDVEVVTPAFNVHRVGIRENVENPSGGIHATLLAAHGWNVLGEGGCYTAIAATNHSQASEFIARKGFELKSGLTFAVLGARGSHHQILAALYGVTGKEEPFAIISPGVSNLRLMAVRDGVAAGTIAPAPQTTVAREVYGLEVFPIENLISEKAIPSLRVQGSRSALPSSNFFFADCAQVKRNDRQVYTRFAMAIKEIVAFVLDPVNESRVKEIVGRKLGTYDLLDRLPEALKDDKMHRPKGLDITDVGKVKEHVESIKRAMVADIIRQMRTDPARDGRIPPNIIDLALEIHFSGLKTREEIELIKARWRKLDEKFFSLLSQ